MKLKINQEKLARLIEAEVNDMIERPFFSEGSFCAGTIGDFEVQVRISRDEDDFFDLDEKQAKMWTCIEEIT